MLYGGFYDHITNGIRFAALRRLQGSGWLGRSPFGLAPTPAFTQILGALAFAIAKPLFGHPKPRIPIPLSDIKIRNKKQNFWIINNMIRNTARIIHWLFNFCFFIFLNIFIIKHKSLSGFPRKIVNLAL